MSGEREIRETIPSLTLAIAGALARAGWPRTESPMSWICRLPSPSSSADPLSGTANAPRVMTHAFSQH